VRPVLASGSDFVLGAVGKKTEEGHPAGRVVMAVVVAAAAFHFDMTVPDLAKELCWVDSTLLAPPRSASYYAMIAQANDAYKLSHIIGVGISGSRTLCFSVSDWRP
jgi:hypothetical protein